MAKSKGYRQKPTVRLDLTFTEISDLRAWMLLTPQEKIDREFYDKVSMAYDRINRRMEDKR